jgi:hypothetical protein
MSVKDYPSQAHIGRIGYVIHSIAEKPDVYLMIRDCMLCGEESRVTVPAQGLWDWEHGEFVQRAFPDLNSDEREKILTGTHPECWDALSGPDDEEDG